METTVQQAAAPKRGLITRARLVAGSALTTLAFVVAGPAISAHAASTTDLTGGAGDTFFSTITSYFTGNVLPSVLTLMALTVGVGVLIKWGKRAAKSS